MTDELEETWIDAAGVDELRKAQKVVVDGPDGPIVVFWFEDRAVALADTCIHKKRELHLGVILNGCIVCPGHQWSFNLDTGYCKVRDRYQPSYPVRIDGDRVLVNPGLRP